MPHPTAGHPPSVPAQAFVQLLRANVDNERLSDASFRDLVRNSLPIVQSPHPDECAVSDATPTAPFKKSGSKSSLLGRLSETGCE